MSVIPQRINRKREKKNPHEGETFFSISILRIAVSWSIVKLIMLSRVLIPTIEFNNLLMYDYLGELNNY